MPIVAYTGPDALPLRVIASPFTADDDWLDITKDEPSDDICFSTLNVRRGTGAPLRAVAISFAFTDSSGVQVIGGTANVTCVAFRAGKDFGLAPNAANMRERIGAFNGADLKEPLILNVTKYKKVGVRMSNISAPATSVALYISIQEFDP